MTELEATDVLFLGCGTGCSAPFFYRCLLPANALGASYAGFYGAPDHKRGMALATSLIRRVDQEGAVTALPDPSRYRVVVMQQPRGPGYLRMIRQLRERGVRVLYEIDDYIHAIQHQEDHDYRQHFERKHLGAYEQCMRAADGIICSTEFIARMYRHFNKRVFVCENGVDLARYKITRPARDTLNIGWSGATGHKDAVLAWVQPVGDTLRDHPETCFVSIGQPWMAAALRVFGPRVIAIPWAAIEQYPGAMSMMDVAIAPAGRGGFFAGKSDLRWLEAGALGIPIVADPVVYPKITHGHDGFHASSPAEVREILEQLVLDEKLRTRVGENARAYVHQHRSIEKMAEHWREVFEVVVNS